MTVVVTGATGHVGANLIRALRARGEAVRVLVHRSRRGLEGTGVEVVHGGVRDIEGLKRVFEGASVVYHLAAVISIDGDPDGRVFGVNVEGARAVATAAREVGVGRLVHFSSVHAFDHRQHRQIDESTSRVPDDPALHVAYDRSKALGEAAVREQIALGLDAVVVHPSGVVGPHDFAPSRFGKALLTLAKGHLPALTPGGYDWVDARDVASSAIAAAECGRTGQSYLLTGRFAALTEIADRVSAVTGVPTPLFTVPLRLARAVAPVGAAVARLLGAEPLFTAESLGVLNTGVRFCHDLATRELDHQPRPLHQTIEDTLRWFSAAGRL